MYDINDSLTIWIGDLDAWVNVDFSAEHEAEQRVEALELGTDEIGEIPRLAGKSVLSRILLSRGVAPDQWRWFLHEAEIALNDA